MSHYQIYRELMDFTILKDSEVDWTGKFKFSLSGYGFEAKSADQQEFRLISKGFWVWRKLGFYKGADQIDRLTPYRSQSFDVALKRGRDIFIEGKEAFSYSWERELSHHGMQVATWDFPASKYDTIIYSLILLNEQGKGQPFGIY
jgi:hypothetical protein